MSNHLDMVSISLQVRVARDLLQQSPRLEEAEAGVVRVQDDAELIVERPPALVLTERC